MTYALSSSPKPIELSLAQWSLHRTFFGASLNAGWQSFSRTLTTNPRSLLRGDRRPIEFASIARDEFDVGAIEYVNTFFFDRANDKDYLNEMVQRANDAGVKSNLIMCDALGMLGAAEPHQRAQTVQNHKPWLDAASVLGCTAIRVNVYGEGQVEEITPRIVEGLIQLGELAESQSLDVLVENHGGLSSNAAWLAGVIRRVAKPNVGSLPDFGNFRLLPNSVPRTAEDPYYDRYQGVAELMPYARAVSAKSNDFDADGDEVHTDFRRMMGIVANAGYQGYVGIEYEGTSLPEFEGIRATKRLLAKVLAQPLHKPDR